MRLKVVLLFALVYFTFTTTSTSQISLSPGSKVTLLTCGPGDELYSVFGHTALRVSDPALAKDIVYNFGTFDFDTPNFYLKFIKGDLQYKLSTSSFEDFVYTYQYFNRDVFEQELDLTLSQREQIVTELERILNSEERLYTYKFIDRNCTTRVADLIEQFALVKIPMENGDKGKTKRKIIIERLDNNFYESLGINLLFGYKTDEELQRLFLPDHLMDGIKNVSTPSGKLAQPVVPVYKTTAEKRMSAWNNFYTYAAVCILLMILSRKKLVARTWLALTGILGIVFCLMGLYSLHTELHLNYNILAFNPLYLLLLAFVFTGRATAIKATSYICLLSIAVYVLLMINKPHLLMMFPLIVLFVVVLLRILSDAGRKVSIT
ncbi:Lnb N-terminal periplasmic domain-containing protein [Flavobacterium sp.]|uniref:Lnb N-terminal periplasmic domain-containing protein n=2 Tax=Flavobacterium sp. TaxID=239 RepID=UPI00403459F6